SGPAVAAARSRRGAEAVVFILTNSPIKPAILAASLVRSLTRRSRFGNRELHAGSRCGTLAVPPARRLRAAGLSIHEIEHDAMNAAGPQKQFFDALAAGSLKIQRCDACSRHVFYPRVQCPHCGAD